MITEDPMIHGTPVACRRKPHRVPSRSRAGGRGRAAALRATGRLMQTLTPGLEPDEHGPLIEQDTILVPRAVAEGVLAEAVVYLQTELPASWQGQLVTRANVIYQRNARFRALIRRDGEAGRDWLWAFMRHSLVGGVDPAAFPRVIRPTAEGLQRGQGRGQLINWQATRQWLSSGRHGGR